MGRAHHTRHHDGNARRIERSAPRLRGHGRLEAELARRRLRDDFDNGEHYLSLSGTQIRVPSSEVERPAKETLEWHADTVFLG